MTVKEQASTLPSVVAGIIDDLMFTFGIPQTKARAALVDALQSPRVVRMIRSFELIGHEGPEEPGCGGCSCGNHQ